MTSNEDNSVHHQMPWYLYQALQMMRIYNLKSRERFELWLNRFEYVVDHIGVPEDKMKDFFFNMVNDYTHKTVEEFDPIPNLNELSYDMIINRYLSYFTPSVVNLHRKRFRHRKQYDRESIEKYVDSLEKIYDKCMINKHWQEKIICKHLSYGIRDQNIKNIFNKTTTLSLNEMIEKANEFSNTDLMTYYVDRALFQINTYHPRYEGFFHIWFNKFEYVADNIRVSDDKIIEFFFQMVDNAVHKKIRKVFPSFNFFKMSYSEIINCYIFYFSKRNCKDIHRERFLCRKQYEHETIKKYAYNLHKIYNMLFYKTLLKEELYEQFINGINDDDIKPYLISLPFLPFDEIVMEAIEYQIEKKEIVN